MSTSVVRRLRQRVVKSALNLVFPERCVLCGEDLEGLTAGPLLCKVCRERLFPRLGPLCLRCAMPVPEIAKEFNRCARCQRERLHFDQATSMGIYQGDLREAVIAMKKSRNETLTWAVGEMLAARLRNDPCVAQVETVVPVPIHWTRRMTRGMNVAELLAERLMSLLGVRVVRDVLMCRRKTKKQGTLSPSERHANVRDAFAVAKRYDLKNARLLLVDDVMTTGATVNEASRTLRRAGAASVSVVVIARAVGMN